MGFRVLVSLHPAIQATGRLTFAPAGLIPAEHTSLRWTHNRTCRFPAFGFPTGFTVRHTGGNQPHAAWARRVTLLRSSTQQSRTTPVFDGVFTLRCTMSVSFA